MIVKPNFPVSSISIVSYDDKYVVEVWSNSLVSDAELQKLQKAFEEFFNRKVMLIKMTPQACYSGYIYGDGTVLTGTNQTYTSKAE